MCEIVIGYTLGFSGRVVMTEKDRTPFTVFMDQPYGKYKPRRFGFRIRENVDLTGFGLDWMEKCDCHGFGLSSCV